MHRPSFRSLIAVPNAECFEVTYSCIDADEGTCRRRYIVNCLDLVAWIQPIPPVAVSIYRCCLPLNELKQNIKAIFDPITTFSNSHHKHTQNVCFVLLSSRPNGSCHWWHTWYWPSCSHRPGRGWLRHHSSTGTDETKHLQVVMMSPEC